MQPFSNQVFKSMLQQEGIGYGFEEEDWGGVGTKEKQLLWRYS